MLQRCRAGVGGGWVPLFLRLSSVLVIVDLHCHSSSPDPSAVKQDATQQPGRQPASIEEFTPLLLKAHCRGSQVASTLTHLLQIFP